MQNQSKAKVSVKPIMLQSNTKAIPKSMTWLTFKHDRVKISIDQFRSKPKPLWLQSNPKPMPFVTTCHFLSGLQLFGLTLKWNMNNTNITTEHGNNNLDFKNWKCTTSSWTWCLIIHCLLGLMSAVKVIESALSVCLGLWDLHCAPPSDYRTTLCTIELHFAPLGTYTHNFDQEIFV